jgi:beta-1,2-mannosidase
VTGDGWQLGPFRRRGAALGALPDLSFKCPVLGKSVRWAAKDLFNPAAVVRDGQVMLLVRGEDKMGRAAGTSRIGLAVSNDGMALEVQPEPVLYPSDDEWQAWEWPGGCEDPRLVESPDGGYICTYTAFDGKVSRLFVASSPDLIRWRKHGPAFAGTREVLGWSKSGSIITEVRDGRLMAAKINDRYWMYWGEGVCYIAASDDLIRWTPMTFQPDSGRYLQPAADGSRLWDVSRVPGSNVLRPVLFPRHGRFDSLLVEPGPPAIRTSLGIVLIYNGANHPKRGDSSVPAFGYQPGQALFDALDPTACTARAAGPFLQLDPRDDVGQVDNVCFAQSLVLLGKLWLLYYGMGDARIGCATAEADSCDLA